MQRSRLLSLTALGLAAFTAPDLLAQGGGKGAIPAGTIYFTFQGSTWTMDAEGGNKTTLPSGVSGEPSYALHGGKRWFLRVQSGELFGVRDDNMSTGPLTNPFDGVTVLETPRWAKDDPGTSGTNESDTTVSYLGMLTSGDRAVFAAAVDFGTGSPVLGVSQSILTQADVPAGKILWAFDSAPGGGSLVYEVRNLGSEGTAGNQFLHVKDLIANQTRFLVNGVDGSWSPAGTKILFNESRFNGDIGTINPNGTGLSIIIQGHAGMAVSVRIPRWAPASTHLVYWRGSTFFGGNVDPDIYRATASGGGKKNLTSDLATSSTGNYVWPVGWR